MGVGGLVSIGNRYVPVSEGDHVDFTPTNEYVSVERLSSGMGLENIYQALKWQDNLTLDTLDQFCEILGSIASNTTLTYGAQGGVYLTGGILPVRLNFWQGAA